MHARFARTRGRTDVPVGWMDGSIDGSFVRSIDSFDARRPSRAPFAREGRGVDAFRRDATRAAARARAPPDPIARASAGRDAPVERAVGRRVATDRAVGYAEKLSMRE